MTLGFSPRVVFRSTRKAARITVTHKRVFDSLERAMLIANTMAADIRKANRSVYVCSLVQCVIVAIPEVPEALRPNF